MNERLKRARKCMGVSQEELGKRIGISGSGVSKVENGAAALTEQVLIAVCREFKINEVWLRTGEGEMFVTSDSTIFNSLASEYGLDALDLKIIEVYLQLSENHRSSIKDFVVELAEAIQCGQVAGVDAFVAERGISATGLSSPHSGSSTACVG